MGTRRLALTCTAVIFTISMLPRGWTLPVYDDSVWISFWNESSREVDETVEYLGTFAESAGCAFACLMLEEDNGRRCSAYSHFKREHPISSLQCFGYVGEGEFQDRLFPAAAVSGFCGISEIEPHLAADAELLWPPPGARLMRTEQAFVKLRWIGYSPGTILLLDARKSVIASQRMTRDGPLFVAVLDTSTAFSTEVPMKHSMHIFCAEDTDQEPVPCASEPNMLSFEFDFQNPALLAKSLISSGAPYGLPTADAAADASAPFFNPILARPVVDGRFRGEANDFTPLYPEGVRAGCRPGALQGLLPTPRLSLEVVLIPSSNATTHKDGVVETEFRIKVLMGPEELGAVGGEQTSEVGLLLAWNVGSELLSPDELQRALREQRTRGDLGPLLITRRQQHENRAVLHTDDNYGFMAFLVGLKDARHVQQVLASATSRAHAAPSLGGHAPIESPAPAAGETCDGGSRAMCDWASLADAEITRLWGSARRSSVRLSPARVCSTDTRKATASAKPAAAAGRISSGAGPVVVVSMTSNRVDLLVLQHESLRRYLKEPFIFVIVNDGPTARAREEIHELAKGLSIRHHVTEFPSPRHETRRIDAAKACGETMNAVMRDVLAKYYPDAKAVLLDADMLLTAPFSVHEYLDGFHMAAIVRDKPQGCLPTYPPFLSRVHYPAPSRADSGATAGASGAAGSAMNGGGQVCRVRYPWNALVLLDVSRLPDLEQFDWRPGFVNGTQGDVGVRVQEYLRSHPEVRARAVQGVDFPCVRQRGAAPLSAEEHVLAALLPDALRQQCALWTAQAPSLTISFEVWEGTWLHVLSTSNWFLPMRYYLSPLVFMPEKHRLVLEIMACRFDGTLPPFTSKLPRGKCPLGPQEVRQLDVAPSEEP
jgi:hypothetical protein